MKLSGPPQVDPPDPRIVEKMGVENIFQLLEDFYLELGKSEIASMFPEDLVMASRKSAAFFTGLCGGPPLYHQHFGNPRLRARHMPFPIDEHSRDVWVECFETVLAEPQKYDFPEEHLESFLNFIRVFSYWMINKE